MKLFLLPLVNALGKSYHTRSYNTSAIFSYALSVLLTYFIGLGTRCKMTLVRYGFCRSLFPIAGFTNTAITQAIVNQNITYSPSK
ncbi:hypothetical protein GDO81_013702 [Engystomops pustulosus]|uniref:Uncharacterized protein n=1 Tax=Engystomops pustulosus TaxID=76066 RepID=A0AAV7B4Y1_ENGPU|nr:hypothetical protein GDO81_013702 [Engystomops pustulosus]